MDGRLARIRLETKWIATDENSGCRDYASRSLNREGREVLRRVFEVGINSISPFELVPRKAEPGVWRISGCDRIIIALPVESRLPVVRPARKIKSAFDRIGREQLSPNKPVTCL
jgi:hypothetical protein